MLGYTDLETVYSMMLVFSHLRAFKMLTTEWKKKILRPKTLHEYHSCFEKRKFRRSLFSNFDFSVALEYSMKVTEEKNEEIGDC